MNILDEILFDEIIPFLDIKTLHVLSQVNSDFRNHIFKEYDIQKYINEKYSIKRKILNERKNYYKYIFGFTKTLLLITIIGIIIAIPINIAIMENKTKNYYSNLFVVIFNISIYLSLVIFLLFASINCYFRSLYYK